MTSAAAFQELVAGIDYPMFIVTATDGERHAGCLVGFVTQASIDPPRLLVMVSVANETYDVASKASHLVVHFLRDENRDLATLFGEQSGDWTDKFAGCSWSSLPDGSRVLDGVRGWVSGRILERLDGGDHVAHLVDVERAETGPDGEPLTFQAVRDMDAGHPA